MHAREIDQKTFETIAAQLVSLIRHDGPVEVVRGRHEAYGDTVLIRDASTCMALVDEPRAMSDGIALARTLRAGRRAGTSDIDTMTGAGFESGTDHGFDDPGQDLLKARLVVTIGSLIEARRLTLDAAAAKLGIGREHLALVLRGRRDVPVERLKGLIEVLEGHWIPCRRRR